MRIGIHTQMGMSVPSRPHILHASPLLLHPSPSPTGTCRYTIVAGDSFYALETKNGWAVGSLTTLNPGVKPTALQIGQVINVPCGET